LIKKIFIATVYLIIFINPNIVSQSASFEIKGLAESKGTISFLRGETSYKLDTVSAKYPGIFTYTFNKDKNHSGFYRLTFGKNKWLDFVYDKDDIEIITSSENIFDSLKIKKSESNKLYFSFIKLNKEYKTKSELLLLMLARYPKDDDFYDVIKGKLINLQTEYFNFVNETSQTNPNSFIAKYIKSAQLAITDINLPAEKQLSYLKSHALDYVDFSNSDLMFSDAFTNKSIEYLTYYRNPQLPKELLEKEFSVAVDTILNKAKVNSFVYKQVTEYLVDGFRKFGFDYVIDYIVDNYVIKDDLCLDSKLTTSIQRRMDQAKNLKIGAIAANIKMPDENGKQIDMSKIEAKKILVIFYASWCPHCNELLPQISELYNNTKERSFEVIAISIDTNKTDWMNFITRNKFKWINACDLKGWSSPAANEYYLYATPSLFVIDNQRKIIAKPYLIEDIKKALF